jgi:hypothetical protein
MSEQPETLSDAQRVAGEQLAAQATAATPTDAGPSLEAMQSDQRQVLLPMEERVNQMMAEFQRSQAEQAAQIAQLQDQLAAARQDVGAPAVELYANGVAALVKAHADANPDVDRARFAPALDLAGQLQKAATDAVASRDPSKVQELAAKVEQWAARGVGKHLDLAGLRADLELLGEAAARLAA